MGRAFLGSFWALLALLCLAGRWLPFGARAGGGPRWGPLGPAGVAVWAWAVARLGRSLGALAKKRGWQRWVSGLR